MSQMWQDTGPAVDFFEDSHKTTRKWFVLFCFFNFNDSEFLPSYLCQASLGSQCHMNACSADRPLGFSSVNPHKFRRPDNHHSAFLHAQVCAEMFRISLEWYRRLLVHVCTVRLSVCGTPCKRMSSDSLLSRRLHLDVSAASMTCPAAGSRKSPQKLPYMALRRAEPVNK